MRVTATNLRKDLFQIIERAGQGEDVFITHKGKQFRLVPEEPVSKLDRLTPMEVFNPDVTDEDWEQAKLKMQADWEANVDKWFLR